MKIEVGKFYRTRDGRKVRIYAVDDNFMDIIHGAILNPRKFKKWTSHEWAKDGSSPYTGQEAREDIVGEWEEPKPKFKAWIRRYDGKITFTDKAETLGYGERAPWLDEPSDD